MASWPIATLTPASGLDPSWHAALHLAARDGLDFGEDVVFTHGPLGFLNQPELYFTATSVLAFVFAVVVELVLCVLLLRRATALFGLPTAALLVYLALHLRGQASDLASMAVFVACIVGIEHEGAAALRRWFAPVAGAVGAALLLVKFSSGAVSLAMATVTVLVVARPRWLGVLALAGSCALTLVLGTLVTGQALESLPRFVDTSLEITAGYSAGVALEEPGRDWEYLVAAVLVLLLGRLAWRHSAEYSRGVRAALLGVLVIFGFTFFKFGFVRHDAHSEGFFAAAAVAALAFVWPPGRARWTAALVVLIAAGSAFRPLTPTHLWDVLGPIEPARAAYEQVRTLTSVDRREQTRLGAREAIKRNLAIAPGLLRELEGRTVHVDPYETSAVWAHELRWGPVPVFQSYAVFTASLDDLNAELLASRRAPARILREQTTIIDGKVAAFESPAYFLALLCNYRELAAEGTWQVLGRIRPRCGEPRLIESREAAVGEVVSIPVGRAGPDELLFARIHVPRRLRDRFRDLVFKPFEIPAIELDGQVYRFLEATAKNPLVLRAPASLGFSSGFAPPSRSSLSLHGVAGPLRVDFLAVRLRVAG